MGPEEESAARSIFWTTILQAILYATVVLTFLWATGGLRIEPTANQATATHLGPPGAASSDPAARP